MDIELIKLKVNNYIEIRKILWTAALVLNSGITALLLNIDSKIKAGLLIIGFIFDILLAYSIGFSNKEIKNCFKQLQKK